MRYAFLALTLLFLCSPVLAAEDEISASDGKWTEEHMARQEFREEMEGIRSEHAAVEAERDHLKIQCMNAKGQERTVCHDKFRTLKQRRNAVHDRIMTLHNKMEAMPVKRAARNPDEPESYPQ
ncbi:MAG: hypothetical protein WAO98_04435 [Alphaproteobacteria bacterium]